MIGPRFAEIDVAAVMRQLQARVDELYVHQVVTREVLRDAGVDVERYSQEFAEFEVDRYAREHQRYLHGDDHLMWRPYWFTDTPAPYFFSGLPNMPAALYRPTAREAIAAAEEHFPADPPHAAQLILRRFVYKES